MFKDFLPQADPRQPRHCNQPPFLTTHQLLYDLVKATELLFFPSQFKVACLIMMLSAFAMQASGCEADLPILSRYQDLQAFVLAQAASGMDLASGQQTYL
jgi:hypothetical protein